MSLSNTNNQVVLGTTAEKVIIPGTASSTGATSGALVVGGGVGIAENLNVGGDITINQHKTIHLNANSSTLALDVFGGTIGLSSVNGNSMRIQSQKANTNNVIGLYAGTSSNTIASLTMSGGVCNFTNLDVKINNTTGSTGTTSGALVVGGGVGIAENLNVGGDLNVGGNITNPQIATNTSNISTNGSSITTLQSQITSLVNFVNSQVFIMPCLYPEDYNTHFTRLFVQQFLNVSINDPMNVFTCPYIFSFTHFVMCFDNTDFQPAYCKIQIKVSSISGGTTYVYALTDEVFNNFQFQNKSIVINTPTPYNLDEVPIGSQLNFSVEFFSSSSNTPLSVGAEFVIYPYCNRRPFFTL